MRAFDVVGYVESRLERVKQSAGEEWTAVCPSCGGWSCFYVNGSTGNHICFKCGLQGRSVVGLVATVEGLDWAAARSYVFDKAVKLRRDGDVLSLKERIQGVRLVDGWDVEDDSGLVDVALPSSFVPVYKGGEWSLPTYLKERGIKSKTAARWKMGYCRHGEYGGRLIIPISCPNGRSFTARDMTGRGFPKYLNPKADHGRLLYGWDFAFGRGDFVVVEGPLDAVKVEQAGFPVVGLGGKAIRDDQLDLLRTFDRNVAVTVMLDPEELLAPIEAGKRLATHFRRVYLAKLPAGTDPGDATRKQLARAIERAELFDGGRVSALKARLRSSRSRFSG